MTTELPTDAVVALKESIDPDRDALTKDDWVAWQMAVDEYESAIKNESAREKK